MGSEPGCDGHRYHPKYCYNCTCSCSPTPTYIFIPGAKSLLTANNGTRRHALLAGSRRDEKTPHSSRCGQQTPVHVHPRCTKIAPSSWSVLDEDEPSAETRGRRTGASTRDQLHPYVITLCTRNASLQQPHNYYQLTGQSLPASRLYLPPPSRPAYLYTTVVRTILCSLFFANVVVQLGDAHRQVPLQRFWVFLCRRDSI